MYRTFFFFVASLILSSCDDHNDKVSFTDGQQAKTSMPSEIISVPCNDTKSRLVSFFTYYFKEQVIDSLSESEMATVKLYVSDLTEVFSNDVKTMLFNKIKIADRDSVYTFYERIDSFEVSPPVLFDRNFKLVKLFNNTDSFAILKVRLLYVSEQCDEAVVLVNEYINPEWGSVKLYELNLDKVGEWKIQTERTVVLN